MGPLAATARDAALAYAAVAGPDPRDPLGRGQPAVDLEGLGRTDLAGLVLGIFPPWFEDAEPGVVAACRRVLDGLVAAGAELREVEVPELDLTRLVHAVTIALEIAASQQAWYDEHRTDYGHDIRLNLLLARHLGGVDYVHAARLRARIRAHWARLFDEVDAVVSPSTGCTAPPLDPAALATGESDLGLLDRIMRFAPAANLAGFPAISIPAGEDAAGLPVGFQVMARPWQEALLLSIAHLAEGFVERGRPRVWRSPLG